MSQCSAIILLVLLVSYGCRDLFAVLNDYADKRFRFVSELHDPPHGTSYGLRQNRY